MKNLLYDLIISQAQTVNMLSVGMDMPNDFSFASSHFSTGLADFFYETIGVKTIVLLVLFLSLILFFMRINRKGEPREGISYIISNTLFLIVCALEIIHTFAPDPIWFCVPDKVGWLWTIVNFILMVGIVFNQLLYLKDVMEDVLDKQNLAFDMLWLGLLSYGGGIVCGFICAFFFQAGIPWVLGIVGILQLVQIILIFVGYKKNFKGGAFASFVYLLGTLGTVAALMSALVLLIIVLLAFAVLALVLKLAGGSDSKSGKVSVDWSDGRSEEAEETGRGILGERYYRGKETGREFQD